MSLSIITTVLNDEKNISNCLSSVIEQKITKNFEHIIVDGGSNDNTLSIVNKFKKKNKHIKLYIKKNLSIYDGINLGIKKSKFKYIGVLHSDDFYRTSNSLKYIIAEFNKDPRLPAISSNVCIVKRNNIKKRVRFFNSRQLNYLDFLKGLHPAHTSLFLKKNIFIKYGFYNNKLKIASDFEFMLRIFGINRVKCKFINKTLIVMRAGGTSTKNLINIAKSNYEVYKAYKINNLNINCFIIIKKIIRKFFQIDFKKIF